MLILPTLDVLQSVPVLGFLSATVTGFMALFPGSLAGVECAAIFAIFTGQVWNMAFGFYHSMVTIPTDMQEAATTYGLSRWQRFRTVELPASAHSLIWNSMMSFGGGWFFVAQSEAISVMNKDIKLPGLGSYMAQAIERGDNNAALWAVVAMIVLILASDQLVWRPLLAWADKFKIELTESQTPATSWVYNLLRGAYLFTWLGEHLVHPLMERTSRIGRRQARRLAPLKVLKVVRSDHVWRAVVGAGLLWLAYEVLTGIVAAAEELRHALSWHACSGTSPGSASLAMPRGGHDGAGHADLDAGRRLDRLEAQGGPLRAAARADRRVVPGEHDLSAGRRLVRLGERLDQLGQHPADRDGHAVVYPEAGNVVAGAMAIPNDLKEAATVYGLRNWNLWRTLILPAIFPFWITGACTAAGGAWNASIVAELASFGSTTLKAEGLGAYIAEVTKTGETPLIIASIAVMSLFVVLMNKFIWRRLYAFAERRFRLE